MGRRIGWSCWWPTATWSNDLDIGVGQAGLTVQRLLDTVRETLAAEGRLELRNFGVFEVQRRAPYRARNPRTGERVDVPAKHVVTFKPGMVMQQQIAGGPRRYDQTENSSCGSQPGELSESERS